MAHTTAPARPPWHVRQQTTKSRRRSHAGHALVCSPPQAMQPNARAPGRYNAGGTPRAASRYYPLSPGASRPANVGYCTRANPSSTRYRKVASYGRQAGPLLRRNARARADPHDPSRRPSGGEGTRRDNRRLSGSLEICVGVGQIGPSGKKRTGAAHPQTHQLLQTDAEAVRRKRSSRPQDPVSWRI